MNFRKGDLVRTIFTNLEHSSIICVVITKPKLHIRNELTKEKNGFDLVEEIFVVDLYHNGRIIKDVDTAFLRIVNVEKR